MWKDLATAFASVIVGVVAAWGAWSSQRQVTKANEYSTRLDYEKEAYERARAYDVGTITSQDAEIAELKLENKQLREELNALRERLRKLEEFNHITEGDS